MIYILYLLIMIDTVTKTFTPLHYTCRHFTSSHLNFTQLHFTALSFGLIPFKFPTSNRNEYQEYFLGGLRRPVCRTDSLTTFMCRLSWNMGTSTSWNPQGLDRPV